MNETTNNTVKVSVGANDPREIEFREGDTITSILRRGEITIPDGHTAVMGNKAVKHPDNTTVQPGDVIVITNKPGHGH